MIPGIGTSPTRRAPSPAFSGSISENYREGVHETKAYLTCTARRKQQDAEIVVTQRVQDSIDQARNSIVDLRREPVEAVFLSGEARWKHGFSDPFTA